MNAVSVESSSNPFAIMASSSSSITYAFALDCAGFTLRGTSTPKKADEIAASSATAEGIDSSSLANVSATCRASPGSATWNTSVPGEHR